MKREELLAKGFNEEQVTDFLNLFHENERLKKEAEAKKTIEQDNANKMAEMQRKLEEIDKANMTKEEQIAERERLANENFKKSKITLNTTIAKNILVGYDIDEETILDLVKEDEQATIDSANRLKAKFDSFKDVVEKKTMETIQNLDVKPNGSNIPQNDGKMTFEKFRSLSQEEQTKFVNEHPEEFNNL